MVQKVPVGLIYSSDLRMGLYESLTFNQRIDQNYERLKTQHAIETNQLCRHISRDVLEDSPKKNEENSKDLKELYFSYKRPTEAHHVVKNL